MNKYQLTGTANRNVAELVLKSLPDIIGAYLTEGHMVGKSVRRPSRTMAV